MESPQNLATPRSVCVFCGSRPGRSPAFEAAATALGAGLAARGLRLVYGAGDVGLMGAVARAAQSAGGETLGVIPQHLVQREQGKRDLSTLVITETMHERKKVMFMNADAIVALPGGPGTLDELFEVLTWRQLGLHAKPIFILNIEGYWTPLITLIEGIERAGFMERSFLDFYQSFEAVDPLLAALDGGAGARPDTPA